MPVTRMFRPLLDHLEKYCADNAHDCPLGDCLHAPPREFSRMALTIIAEGEGPPQRIVRDTRCQQCTFVLLLQSIQRNVPEPQVQAWLDQPLIDLKGKTPRECLNKGEVIAVINALWLIDQRELTSG